MRIGIIGAGSLGTARGSQPPVTRSCSAEAPRPSRRRAGSACSQARMRGRRRSATCSPSPSPSPRSTSPRGSRPARGEGALVVRERGQARLLGAGCGLRQLRGRGPRSESGRRLRSAGPFLSSPEGRLVHRGALPGPLRRRSRAARGRPRIACGSMSMPTNSRPRAKAATPVAGPRGEGGARKSSTRMDTPPATGGRDANS